MVEVVTKMKMNYRKYDISRTVIDIWLTKWDKKTTTKTKSPMASSLSHSAQHKGAALISIPRHWASGEPTFQPIAAWTLVDVGGRPYLSPRLLPFVSITHYNMDYYSLTDPGGMKGWVGHVGWPVADGVTTKRSPVQLAVWRRIGKVRRPTPALYPLCYGSWN